MDILLAMLLSLTCSIEDLALGRGSGGRIVNRAYHIVAIIGPAIHVAGHSSGGHQLILVYTVTVNYVVTYVHQQDGPDNQTVFMVSGSDLHYLVKFAFYIYWRLGNPRGFHNL